MRLSRRNRLLKAMNVRRFVTPSAEPEELKNISVKTTTEMPIEGSVNLAEVDPIYFETSYYVVPEEAGQKAYALLYPVTELVAMAQLATHRREHGVILRSGDKGFIDHTMFFNSEVRADEEYTADTAKVTQKELRLAETLIRSLETSFQPRSIATCIAKGSNL